jgi:hypothetical protein
VSDSAAPSAPVAGIALVWLLRALAGNKPTKPVRLAIPHDSPTARPVAAAAVRVTPPGRKTAARGLVIPAMAPWPFPPGLRQDYAAPVPAQWTSDRELLAWRAWRLAYWSDERWPYLVSLGVPWLWGGPVLRADHLPEPVPMNRSGVHAIKASLYGRLDWMWSPPVRVIGWVALSGRVIEHELGYRAERAVIRRLRFSVGMHLAERDLATVERIARQLEDHYQAPVKMGWTERRQAQALYASGCRSDAPAVVRCSPRSGWRVG